jgi:hypothetical protein
MPYQPNYALTEAIRLNTFGTSPASGDATENGDRFAFPMGDRILVVNQTAGHVYAHALDGDNVGNAVQLNTHGTSPASGDKIGDNFCFAMGDRIIVVNTSGPGAVYSHLVVGNDVNDAERMVTVGRSPNGQLVFPMDDRIITVRGDGVFSHSVIGNEVQDAVRMNERDERPLTDWVNRFAFAMGDEIVSIRPWDPPVLYSTKVDGNDIFGARVRCLGTVPASGAPTDFGDRFAFAHRFDGGDWHIIVINAAAGMVFRHDRVPPP